MPPYMTQPYTPNNFDIHLFHYTACFSRHIHVLVTNRNFMPSVFSVLVEDVHIRISSRCLMKLVAKKSVDSLIVSHFE